MSLLQTKSAVYVGYTLDTETQPLSHQIKQKTHDTEKNKDVITSDKRSTRRQSKHSFIFQSTLNRLYCVFLDYISGPKSSEPKEW